MRLLAQTCGQNYTQLSSFGIRTKKKKLFHVLLAYEIFYKFIYLFSLKSIIYC